MKRTIATIFMFVLVAAFVRADMIMPGTHPIEVRNVITNINDFPDYVFVSTGSLGPGMCPVKLVSSSGEIEGYYKFCSVSIYAIKKSEFNEKKLLIDYSKNYNESEREDYYNYTQAYFSSKNVKKVISNVETYNAVSDSSSQKQVLNEYTIILDRIKDSPNNKVVERDYKIYAYPIISSLALVVILSILFLRKKGEENAS